jgi:hypothetical protein
MNNVNRQEIIQFVRQATTSGNTLSGTSMTTLRDMAEKYGEQQQRVDDVNDWLDELEEMNFEDHNSIAETNEWFKQWLSELP